MRHANKSQVSVVDARKPRSVRTPFSSLEVSKTSRRVILLGANLAQELKLPNGLKQFQLVQAAVDCAKKVHASHTRDDGSPYIHHPFRVCLILYNEFHVRDENVFAAAILHDSVEMSNTTIEQLARDFNPVVAEMVNILSKTTASSDEEYYRRLQQANPDTQKIKFADRLDNIRDLPTSPSRKKRVSYIKETKRIFVPWARSFDAYIHGLLQDALKRAEATV